MSDDDTLRLEFEVRAPVAHAFRVWTGRASLWWPGSHTVSGDPESVVFERGVGGRILERGKDGAEHVWGEITRWEEPHRLAFTWVHVFHPSQATRVAITFEPVGATTRVVLEPTGFAALGPAGVARRGRTHAGWSHVAAAYTLCVERDDDRSAAPSPGS